MKKNGQSFNFTNALSATNIFRVKVAAGAILTGYIACV
jgi:hypothetical protein